ncbi:MAG: hypothetical protein K8R53_01405, partial [Bacteroidales bacterium]|nr:hypothetical protein [Bacteroidales bacterium]
EGDIGDKIVTQTNGDRLAEIWGTSSGSASTALDNVMANQTLTIYGSTTGTHKIDIQDSGGDAKRSAASIAAALNAVDGVTAYASKTEAEFDISGISNAQDGDTVKYSLYVDGYVYAKSFIVDSNAATLAVQFEDSLVEAVNAINSLNLDTDLYADAFKFSSDKGATLGVQDFEVLDNAGIQLDTFSNFNNTDTVTLKITSDGVPTTSTTISVDLTGVNDVSDQAEVSTVFYTAISTALASGPFSVEKGTAADSILIRSTDGSNVTLREAGDDTGNDATINLTSLSGTSSGAGNTSLEFTAAAIDVETFNSLTTSGDTVTFGMPSTITTAVAGTSAVITEGTYTGAGATTSAVISGTVTTLLDSGMSIQSDAMTGTGLFGTAGTATTGSSIITLGGEDGFTNFDLGDTISFDVDGNTVSFTIASAGGGTTEAGIAQQLYNELNTDIASTDYSFIRNGKSVSIIKSASLEDPIEITNFLEDVGNDARLAVSTGTGQGASDPENDLLESGNIYRDFSTSSLYADEAIIKWERLDENGDSTGNSGLLTIEDVGTVTIVENGSQTVSFDISKGSLVAGNILNINMDTTGEPDPMDLRIFRQAKSINDIYHFKVTSGGKVGHVPAAGEDNLTIEWYSSVSSGSFEIKGHTPPRTPEAAIEIEVDGMILNFYDGTLFEGDVFTITTDESGIPGSINSTGQATGEFMSDWHWTLDSFKDQFNRKAGGMKASINLGSQLKMQSSDNYFVMENVEYSGSNGFSSENTTIEVLDWTALNFQGLDFQFVRSSGSWGILNDTTGGVAQIIPAGGDDDGFKVDLNGDGVGDIKIDFARKVTGDGYVRFDLLKHNAGDIRYAFGDDVSTGSGIMAAAGINTFFNGSDSITMEINEKLSDTKYIVSGKIDSMTGAITQGDNENALAMADIQHQSMTMKHWEFNRGTEAQSSIIESTLDDYYNTMVGTLGVKARSIKTSREFADIMVSQMTEQRNAVSAVSLDEEMIKLMKYQHAFSAASKLLTVADEMLSTLISVR